MLVYHLRDRILEQHDKLIKGLDLTLKFDAVDQIDGYGDSFLAQGVEVRVL